MPPKVPTSIKPTTKPRINITPGMEVKELKIVELNNLPYLEFSYNGVTYHEPIEIMDTYDSFLEFEENNSAADLFQYIKQQKKAELDQTFQNNVVSEEDAPFDVSKHYETDLLELNNGFISEEGIAPDNVHDLIEFSRNNPYTDNVQMVYKPQVQAVITESSPEFYIKEATNPATGEKEIFEYISGYSVEGPEIAPKLIQKGDPEYDQNLRKWRLDAYATNKTVEGNENITRVELSGGVRRTDVIEDAIVEPILRGIKQRDPEFWRAIESFGEHIERTYYERTGLPTPYGGAELISKLYSAQILGYNRNSKAIQGLQQAGAYLPEWMTEYLKNRIGKQRDGVANVQPLVNGPYKPDGAMIPSMRGKYLEGESIVDMPLTPYSLQHMNGKQLEKMVNSGRVLGFTGKNPLAWQFIKSKYGAEKNEKILDYGAGHDANQTKELNLEGYDITAHELKENRKGGLHEPEALRFRYDWAVASNVVNVQPNISSVKAVIDELYSTLNPGGKVVVNLPSSPRYNNLTPSGLKELLRNRFDNVEQVDGSTSNPVFIGTRRKTGTKTKEEVARPLQKVIDVKIDYKNSDAIESYIISKALPEIVDALESPTFRLHDQLTWYTESVSRSMDIVSHEAGMGIIKEKPEYEQLFKTVIAITSHQTDLITNFNVGVHAFKDFLSTGKFNLQPNKTGKLVLVSKNQQGNSHIVGAVASPAVGENIIKLQYLIDNFGVDGAMKYLNTPHKVADLIKMVKDMGFKSDPAHMKIEYGEMYGSAIIGPKIGRFGDGIKGFDSEAVYDMWFLRMWGRWTGQPFDTYKDGRIKLDKKGRPLLRGTPANLEREAMDRVMDVLATELSKELNYPFTKHSVQALLWGMEKSLWEKMGLQPELSLNYLNAAVERAERKGYDEQLATSESLERIIKDEIRDYYRSNENFKSLQKSIREGRARKILEKRGLGQEGKLEAQIYNPHEAPAYFTSLEATTRDLLLENPEKTIPANQVIKTLKTLGADKLEIDVIDLKHFLTQNYGTPKGNISKRSVPIQKIADFIESNNFIVQSETFFSALDPNLPIIAEPSSTSASKQETQVFTLGSPEQPNKIQGKLSIHLDKNLSRVAVLDNVNFEGIQTVSYKGNLYTSAHLNLKIAVKEFLRRASNLDADFIHINDKVDNNSGYLKDVLSSQLGVKPESYESVSMINFSLTEQLPIKVYHTTFEQFKNFDIEKGDLGIHFGTKDQALDRHQDMMSPGQDHFLTTKGRELKPTDEARLIKVELYIQNPLRLKDIGGWWEPGEVWTHIKDLLSSEAIPELAGKGIFIPEAEMSHKELREWIKSLGYDGIVYKNTHEGVKVDKDATASLLESDPEFYEGTTVRDESSMVDSYIAFDESQIRIKDELPLNQKTKDAVAMFSLKEPKETEDIEVIPVDQSVDKKLNPIVPNLKLNSNPNPEEPQDIPGSIYKADEIDLPDWKKESIRDIRIGIKSRLKKASAYSEFLIPISTRLAKIDPALEMVLRNFEFQIAQDYNRGMEKVRDFSDNILMELSKEQRLNMELALLNQDEARVLEIIESEIPVNKRPNAYKALENYRQYLDEVYRKALNVGYEVEYRNFYFPRKVKNYEDMLVDLYKENPESHGVIMKAITKKEKQLKRELTPEEEANLVSNVIRGYETISGSPGNTKGRRIEFIDKKLYKKHYLDFLSASESYIRTMSEGIRRSELFGKGEEGRDDIGTAVAEMLEGSGLSIAEQKEVISIFRTRFGHNPLHKYIPRIKNTLYAMLLMKVTSVITQIGDMGWTVGRTGLYAIPAIAKALANQLYGYATWRLGTIPFNKWLGYKEGKRQSIPGMLTKEDLGVEKIAQEFSGLTTSAQFLDWGFKKIGFNSIDRLGKESYVEGVYQKYRRAAKKIVAGKRYFILDNARKKDFYTRVLKVFGTKEAADLVIQDLAKGKITDDVKLLMFCEICNIQPVSMSEMPEKYLTGNWSRLGYQLKTFTVKMFDVFRREGKMNVQNGLNMVRKGYEQKEEGKRTGNKKQQAEGEKLLRDGLRKQQEGYRKLLWMALCFYFADMGQQATKDALRGKEVEFDEYAVEGILRLVGFSKWTLRMGKEGHRGGWVAALTEGFLPTGIIESVYRTLHLDVDKAIKVAKGDATWEETYFSSHNYVPLVDGYSLTREFANKYGAGLPEVQTGNLYYMWGGGGKVREVEKKRDKILEESKEGAGSYDSFTHIKGNELYLYEYLAELREMNVIELKDIKSTLTRYYNNLLKPYKERVKGVEEGEIFNKEEEELIYNIIDRMWDAGLITDRGWKSKNKLFFGSDYVPSKEEESEKKAKKAKEWEKIYEESNE